MNQTEILAMLHNIIANNTHYTTWTVSTPHLVALVNKVIADEREACAKLVQDNAMACEPGSMLQVYLASNATAIRARGQA